MVKRTGFPVPPRIQLSNGNTHLSVEDLDRITVEVAQVLTNHGIDGYQYNEPMNMLRRKLADALVICSVETDKFGPKNWAETNPLYATQKAKKEKSKYRSIDDESEVHENLSERPESTLDRRLENILPWRTRCRNFLRRYFRR